MTEHEFEELGEMILKTYSEAEFEMLRRVSRRLSKGIRQPGWTEVKAAETTAARREIEAILSKAHTKSFTDPLLKKVTGAYGGSQAAWVYENRRLVEALSLDTQMPNAAKVATILRELSDNVNAAERLVLRQFDDKYAKVIGHTSSLVATGTYTNRQALAISLREFADEGITGFTDRAGRRWNLSSYAEMALLTSIERASREGYMDMMRMYGYDLAVISSHVGACPICAAWENVIISISGSDSRYPSLDDAEAAGVFHPRCMHDYYTYHESIDDGTTRDRPRPIEEPAEEYTARSEQRYMERQVRKYKNRMAVAADYVEEREAYNKVKYWQSRIRAHLVQHEKKVLPRKYWREGGRVKLRFTR